ncbi:condensation domain-containing protein [Streptomyces sp. NPDC048297]|uniref:condensation domain-containing protein n=1 Tax=Streptomyces sp. NPDC048297 TaxID=3365531 RepID=UPI00372147F0
MTTSFPLSAAQRTVWDMHRKDPSGHRQSTQRTFVVTGPLDLEALRTAVDMVVERHEPLRTVFLEGPVQRIRPHLPAPLDIVSTAPEPRAYDLTQGPLLRLAVRELGDLRYEVTVFLHLLAADGWSMDVFFADLSACYRAARHGKAPELPALPVQYVDYAAWQNGRLGPERIRELEEWWRAALDGYPVPAPRDSPPDASDARPAKDGVHPGETRPGEHAPSAAWPPGRAKSHVRTVSADRMDALRALARRRAQSMFSVLAAGCALALTRDSGQDRVLLGLAVANRDRPEIERALGFFVTLTVLPVDLRDARDFGALAERVAQARAATYSHRELPLHLVAAATGLPESDDGTFSLPAVFAHHPAGSLGTLELDGCEIVERPDPDTARFALTIRAREASDGSCEIRAEYDRAHHPDAEISALLDAYEAVLHDVSERHERHLDVVPTTVSFRATKRPGGGGAS